MDCEKCPIAEECGLADRESKTCPLVALISEWRIQLLKKIARDPKKHVVPYFKK